MEWVKDPTGRFSERPHYQPEELDMICEDLAYGVLRKRHNGRLVFPIPTDDLTVMIEQAEADLDTYADLSEVGSSVEGVTEFFQGKKPLVRISRELSEKPNLENRYRTTLTHECSHVKLHGFLWEIRFSNRNLLKSKVEKQTCKREVIESAGSYDWMEWQANYASGAILMPLTNLKATIKQFFIDEGSSVPKLDDESQEAWKLLNRIRPQFGVSELAARVRLIQLGVLVKGLRNQPTLWS
jgi:hypothetical protein